MLKCDTKMEGQTDLIVEILIQVEIIKAKKRMKRVHIDLNYLLTKLATYSQCGKTKDTVKKIELTKDLWNMNDIL